ncbi:BTAD domain-containing putative transcriptional regulator [Streptomyces sp. NPDC048057]|uniref:AfsR/SARP family transcriptional regulator n=1 Tax=Streptomyces sp. NPDC048057 TaxID=3155628 RepID=UPI00340BF0D2
MTDGGMRFRILGGLEWLAQGASLRIGRRRERLLLGLLLLEFGRVVPANRLINLLWDEGPKPSSVRGSLQVHVSRLRGRFTAEDAEQYGFALVKSGDGYLIEGDPSAVDLHRFRYSLQRAERAENLVERLRLLDRALADWGGPVLAGTAPDGLVRRLGAGFEESYISAVTQRAEARLLLGRRELVLEELARATAEHPHHERLAMLRMIALYRADHRGEALEVYNETRSRLAEDLGLDPGADLQHVQRMILHADPMLMDDEVIPRTERGRIDPSGRVGWFVSGVPEPRGRGDQHGAGEPHRLPGGGRGRSDGWQDPASPPLAPAASGPRGPSDEGAPASWGVAEPGDADGTAYERHQPHDRNRPQGLRHDEGHGHGPGHHQGHPLDQGRRSAPGEAYGQGRGHGSGTRPQDPARPAHPQIPARPLIPVHPPAHDHARPQDHARAHDQVADEPVRPEAESVQSHSRTGAFIGRAKELAQLGRLVEDASGGSGVLMIVGPAGSGKTALALQWCRGSRDAFPDGQLFLDLRGHSDESPMGPKEALSGLLRALGTPYQDIPCDLAEMAELYQRTLCDRRVLILLDNAESAAQVRQLLPYDTGCLALVTSRNRLGSLIVTHGASMLPLRPLAADDAKELVRSVVGRRRSAAEPDALAELVAMCGRSPLALRIAAANLALHPEGLIAQHVRELRSGNPLETLAVAGDPDSAVRRAFELSYRRLDAEARDAFRTLGILPGPATTVPAVAALLGRSVAATVAILDRLFAEHLVELVGRDRLRLHDLIWWYARLLVDAEDPVAAQREARRRLLRWYVASADSAARCLYPQMLRLEVTPLGPEARPATFDDPQRAADWFDAEHAELVRLIEAEAAAGTSPTDDGAAAPPDASVWILADILRGYFWLRRHTNAWITVASLALATAREGGDFRGQAAAQQSLGLARFTMGDLERSKHHFELAIELARCAGWGVGESVALSNLAGVSGDLGLLSQAAEYYGQSIAIDRKLRRSPSQPLLGLGEVLHGMGRLREAERLCRRALALSHKIGAPDSVSRISCSLATISLDLGLLVTAQELAVTSQRGFQAIGNLPGEAEVLSVLAMIGAEAGDGQGALRAALTACRLSRRSGRPRLRMDAMIAMGHARYQLGQYERAFEHFRIAHRTAEGIGYLKGRTMALLGLGVCAARLRRPLEALGYAASALTLAKESQLRLLEGQAQAVIALSQGACGDTNSAARAGRLALDIYTSTGYRPLHSPFGRPVEGIHPEDGFAEVFLRC